uniref:gamma-glutamylcyclotransferase n=1 Tax=Strombidinopsis acuminata TaxID=141414 RepID=A0A7S3SXV2_9SPIT
MDPTVVLLILTAAVNPAMAGFVKPPPSTTPGGFVVEYFAIGSNMKEEVMTKRRRITPVAPARPAVAPNHELTFDVPGLSVLEPAFAAIKPNEGRECHGVLYTLTPADWLRLLASEGVPLAYRPVPLTVECYDGRRVEAMSLGVGAGIPTAQFRGTRKGVDDVAEIQPRPSQRYLNLLREGARESGLAATWVEYLEGLQPAPGSADAPNSRPQTKRNYEQRPGATFI